MSVAEFSDAALVLLGHGSTLNAASADAVWHHADAFRRRRLFAEVREAFILLEPSVRGVLRGVFSPRVFLVPLFVSEGWFTREVIPLQLGLRGPGAIDFSRVQRHGTQTWHYGRAVGTHDSMTDVLLARARGIVARHPFPRCPRESDTALFIAGHGTAYSRGSRDAIEHQVECLRRRGAFAEVHAIFLEEDPRIDRC